jgi:hypothetical protein
VTLPPNDIRTKRLHGSRITDLTLLGTIGGRSIYRVGDSAHPCYGVGNAGTRWPLGVIVCRNAAPYFPSRETPLLDFSRVGMDRGHAAMHYIRVEGVAADGVASVGLLERDGAMVERLPVRGNVYGAESRPRAPAFASSRSMRAATFLATPLLCREATLTQLASLKSLRADGRGRPDVRPCVRDCAETEPLEDRPTVGRSVNLQVAPSSLGCELRAAAHERAIDATPAPRGQRRATPKGCEVGAAREPHPPGRDDEAIRLSDENRETSGISGELLLEGGGVPAFAAVAPGRSLELADPLKINPVADLAEYDAAGSRSAVRQRRCLGYHDRLEFLRDEPGGSQALLEKGRTVVAVELPLERLISFGEPGDLRVDQPIQLCPAQIPEVAVLDPPVITEPEGADEWALALDGGPCGKTLRDVRPQLLLVEVEQSVRLTYHAL